MYPEKGKRESRAYCGQAKAMESAKNLKIAAERNSPVYGVRDVVKAGDTCTARKCRCGTGEISTGR
jgi:hypothetical protein